jgi:hypothetical protein
MANNKTTEASNNADDFINSLKDKTKREDSFELIRLLKQQAGCEPKNVGTEHCWFWKVSL